MMKSLVTEILGMPLKGNDIVGELQQFPELSLVLMVFSDADNAMAARQENMMLSERSALAEHDLRVLRIRGGTVLPLFGTVADMSAENLRQAFDVEAGEFKAVLIAKDGTAMLQVTQPITAAEVFTILDSMLRAGS